MWLYNRRNALFDHIHPGASACWCLPVSGSRATSPPRTAMHRPHSLPHQGRRQTATNGALTDYLLHDGGSGRPASPASLVPEPFSPCLLPQEAELLLHGPAAPGGFVTADASHHHHLVPSFLAAPCSQDPGREPHPPTHAPCGYVAHAHPPSHAETRKKAKAAKSRQRRMNERRALEAELGELLLETETLEAEKRRLQHVTNLMQQDLGRRGEAGAWQMISASDSNADASAYS